MEQRRPERQIKPTTIIAILLAGLIPLVIWLVFTSGESGDFQDYAGPILPMTSLSGGENVTAQRNVTLDFGNFENPTRDPVAYPNTVIVTDSYDLTNTSQQDVTMDLVVGVEAQFTDQPERIPTITVDGETVSGVLYPSTGYLGAMVEGSNYKEYAASYTNTDLLSIAMADTPQWDVPVKVYHFYDMSYEAPDDQEYLLNVAFWYGEETNLWVPIYYMQDFDQKNRVEHLFFHLDGEAWLYVIGDDLVDMRITCTTPYDREAIPEGEQSGFHYELETYESTFMECLWKHAQEYEYESYLELSPVVDMVTPEMLFTGAMKRIVGTWFQESADTIRLMDDIFHHVYAAERMLYWVFPVEIPAGETVNVTASYAQETSCDYLTPQNREGFDMATTLGSNLQFTGQTVTAVNTQFIAIGEEGKAQNFGFDFAKGITTVELDMKTDRYYLDISFDQ